jgi:predicted GIY-YIG superfamily endonuclease
MSTNENLNWRFRAANPQFNGSLQCLYVGQSSTTPKERFAQHKTGHKNKSGHKISAYFVEKYGQYLRPSLYNHLNPIKSRDEALKMERLLSLELRRKGYAVWFN